jgi:hypothetical protein
LGRLFGTDLSVAVARTRRERLILHDVEDGEAERLSSSCRTKKDVESMRIAMKPAEQRACIEDIQGSLSHVTILIQREGERRQRGAVERLPVKFVYLLAGSAAAIRTVEDRLFADLAASFSDVALRVNPIIDRDFSVDPTVSAGGQVIDAVLELWLPKGTHDAVTQRIPGECPSIGTIGAFRVNELILKDA